jgi:hypothetical protein
LVELGIVSKPAIVIAQAVRIESRGLGGLRGLETTTIRETIFVF